jgi:hypothetical protein
MGFGEEGQELKSQLTGLLSSAINGVARDAANQIQGEIMKAIKAEVKKNLPALFNFKVVSITYVPYYQLIK